MKPNARHTACRTHFPSRRFSLDLGMHRWKTTSPSLMCLAFAFAVALMPMGCRPRQVQTDGGALSTASFVGPWVASAVDVAIRTKQGGSQDDAIHYDSKELALRMGRKPVMTLFQPDGSYREETYNTNDSLVQSKAGFWHFYSDSLYMRPDVEFSPRIAYLAALDGGKGLLLKSTIDWDGDGAKDDEMVVTLRRP